MINLSQGAFTHDQIINLLSFPHGAREVQYRIDVLRRGAVVATADHHQCTYECDSTRNAAYRASMVVNDNPMVDWTTDLLQPVMLFAARNPLANFEFRLCPLRPVTVNYTVRNGVAARNVEAYDDLIWLEGNSIGEVLYIPRGTLYTAAINSLLERGGFGAANILPSPATIQTDREDWSEDTDIITIANQLLEEMGYNKLTMGFDGIPTAAPYEPPGILNARVQYTDSKASILLPELSVEADTYKKTNRFIGVVANPDMEPLRYVFVNDDPASPTSTINTGRTVTEYRTYDNVADFDALVTNVQRWAAETARSYERVNVQTAIMPHHEVRETVILDTADFAGICAETSWSISDWSASGIMTHTLEVIR